MGEAFVFSLVKQKIFKPEQILVIDKNQNKRKNLQEKYKIKTSSNISDIKNYNIIFLAIKPQNLEDLPVIDCRNKIIISILAGTKISKISKKFTNTKIVRTMPNLGQFVNNGMTGIYFDNSTKFTKEEKIIVKKIFNSGGKIIEVKNENKLDAITAISGSGPAYFFYFLEIFEEIAKKMGFKEKDAEMLVKQTFFGASKILKENQNETARNWRKRVTSKGGTTEAACNILKNSEFKNIFTKAIESAQKKAEELGND